MNPCAPRQSWWNSNTEILFEYFIRIEFRASNLANMPKEDCRLTFPPNQHENKFQSCSCVISSWCSPRVGCNELGLDSLNHLGYSHFRHSERANMRTLFWAIAHIHVKLLFEMHFSCTFISHSWIPLYINKIIIFTPPCKRSLHRQSKNKNKMYKVPQGDIATVGPAILFFSWHNIQLHIHTYNCFAFFMFICEIHMKQLQNRTLENPKNNWIYISVQVMFLKVMALSIFWWFCSKMRHTIGHLTI